MAIFFKIKDQVFKSPSRIIVGRGAPFSILNDDREVARAHLLMLQKNDGEIYIKNLCSKFEVTLNGKVLGPKFYKIVLGDEIRFGKQTLGLVAESAAKDYVEISRSKPEPKASSAKFALLLVAIFFLPIAFMTKGRMNDFSTIIVTLGIALAIMLMMYFQMRIMNFLMEKFSTTGVKEVFISEDGFTVHYAKDKSMTFKLNEIKSWFISPNLHSALIHTKNEGYLLQLPDQFSHLTNFLEKNLSDKKLAESPKSELKNHVFTALLALCAGTYFFYREEIIGVVALSVLGTYFLAMGFSKKLLDASPFPVSKVFSMKRKQAGMIAWGCLVYSIAWVSYLDVQDYQPNLILSSECKMGNDFSCKNINLSIVDKKDTNLITLACSKGNEHSMCRDLKKRNVASENP